MFAMKIKTERKINPQFQKFLANVKGARDSYVTIGLHEDAGRYPQADLSVVEVGLWNEFGTENIPERSWLRAAISDNISEIKMLRVLAIKKMMTGEMNLQSALEMVGFRIQLMVQNKIKSNVPPENAPSTVAAKLRKGIAPNTLIESGLLLRSLTFKVVLK